MKEKAKGTVIIIPTEKPETAEQMARRIFNMSIAELTDKFLS